MILKPAPTVTTNNNNRNKYAPSSAPWKRPEAEMEETDSDDDPENHTDPGAFRVVGRQSISVLDDKQKMDLIQVAQQVGEDLEDTEDQTTANAHSSIVSVGSAEGGGDAGTSWDTETATMDMLVQLKRRSSTRKLIPLPDNTIDEGTDQQQEEEVLSTDCHWASGGGEEQKEAAHKPLNRVEKHFLMMSDNNFPEQPKPSYATSTAPWTRPTGERQVSGGELEENHTTPGAFRVSEHLDSKNGALRQCDRISFSEDIMEEDEEADEIIVMEDEATDAAFASSDVEQSKEVLEQLKRRKERKLESEM